MQRTRGETYRVRARETSAIKDDTAAKHHSNRSLNAETSMYQTRDMMKKEGNTWNMLADETYINDFTDVSRASELHLNGIRKQKAKP